MNNAMNTNNYLSKYYCILDNMANKMFTTPVVNNITVYFINCMIPHHMAAIEMCKNLLNYTKFKPLIDISNNIISTQTKGIEQMRKILRTTNNYINSEIDVDKYVSKYFMITNNMVNDMRNSPKYLDINLDFILEMIPHHRGAVEMCNNLITYRIDPRLRKVALNIIKEQSEGIKQLEFLKETLQ